jgi:hypothetical protein
MGFSTTDKELLKYFTRLNESQKKSLLELIRTFLKSNSNDSERVSIEQYNQELDEALQRISNGEFTTLADLEKEMQSW